ncbi:MAG: chromate transporter [Candidatus Binataceae bacterium]
MPPSNTANESAPAAKRVSLFDLFKLFFMAGLVSFGGGVVAYEREYVVGGAKWLTDEDFLATLEISETLPGLNSVNIAVIVGDNLRGIPGALAAVIGLMIPGAIIVMTLGVLWTNSGHNPRVNQFLLGIAAAAVGMLSVVTLQLGRRQFTKPLDLAIILITFAAVSVFRISLVWVLLVIAPFAIYLYRPGSSGSLAQTAELHMPFHRGPRHGNLRH